MFPLKSCVYLQTDGRLSGIVRTATSQRRRERQKAERQKDRIFQVLIGGLELHAKGLPKWMAVHDVDHLSSKEKSRIVSAHVLAPPPVVACNRLSHRWRARVPVMEHLIAPLFRELFVALPLSTSLAVHSRVHFIVDSCLYRDHLDLPPRPSENLCPCVCMRM